MYFIDGPPRCVIISGLTYRTGDEGRTMVTAGPMARYTEDLIPLFKVLLGEKTNQLQLDQQVNIKDLNVYFIFETGDPKCSSIRPEMCDAFSRYAS